MAVKADLQLVIDLLKEIDKLDSEEAQLAAIERRIVDLELSGVCLDFYDLKHAFKVLSKVTFTNRHWSNPDDELVEFLSA